MVRGVKPLRLLGLLAGLLVVAGLVLTQVPSDKYLLLPDPAHPVAPLVRVQGGHQPGGAGGIYFVDVRDQPASVFDSWFPFVRSGASLVPASDVVPPGVSNAGAEQIARRQMTMSQRFAAAVALHRLGYHVLARANGVIVDALLEGTHAIGKLEQTDVIVSANGVPTATIAKLHAALASVRPGQIATLGVLRGVERITVRVQTVADPLDRTRAIIGFAPRQSAEIHLPLKVQIDAGNVGGPSAGLAFALQIMEELGPKIDRGYRVAATGEIMLDGTVGPIGGVKQKTFGAREAHADVFLVPAAGDNAAEARRYANGLRIIAVQSFPQALRALATLPPKGK
jgi:PDZ domain-containing protein